MRFPNPPHDLGGNSGRPAARERLRPGPGGPSSCGGESLELVNRDEDCARWRLDRLDEWKDGPIEGGPTDAERLSRLAAGVREPFHTLRLSDEDLLVCRSG
jgi:hypothetical protein